MEFHERWIQKVMLCVKIVSFSILINGEPMGPIMHYKGLSQMTPYMEQSISIVYQRSYYIITKKCVEKGNK